ncbi:LysR substrate-binding domain-containing protein [Endozoicomonas lisbonensis]|uniref:Aminoethylphosphonate catabolism LysR family transcriptional regulator n=1 Tax=Endozoicomonas lisbonensis TaxID=3120522 RepID=A0ABV2SLT5_9GAMM
MKFSQLRSFHAVARTGSFSKAAEQLHISQPTITAQIRELESYYNVQLLRRQRGNNQLTETGAALYQQTQMIFALEKKAKQILRSDGRLLTGTLKIGAVSPPFFMPILKEFHARYPGIKLEVETGGSELITQKVLNGQLDAGMIAYSKPDERLFSFEFSRQRIILMAPKDDPIVQHRQVTLSMLHNQPMIQREKGSTTRQIFEQAIAEQNIAGRNIKPRIIMEVSSREAVRQATASGLGLSYVGATEYLSHPDIKAISIADLDEFSCSYVICHNAQRHTPMTNAFIEVALPLSSQFQGEADEKKPPQVKGGLKVEKSI